MLKKSRTAFTNHQIYELRSAFSTRSTCPLPIATICVAAGPHQCSGHHLVPESASQAKRDLEEMKADVETAKKLGPAGRWTSRRRWPNSSRTSEAAGGGGGGCSRLSQGLASGTSGAPQAPGAGPLHLSPASPPTDQPASSQDCSGGTRKTKKSTWTIEQRPASSTAPRAPSAGCLPLPDRTAEGSWDLLCNSRLLPVLGPDSAPGSRLFPLEAQTRADRRSRSPRAASTAPEPSPCSSVWLCITCFIYRVLPSAA